MQLVQALKEKDYAKGLTFLFFFLIKPKLECSSDEAASNNSGNIIMHYYSPNIGFERDIQSSLQTTNVEFW